MSGRMCKTLVGLSLFLSLSLCLLLRRSSPKSGAKGKKGCKLVSFSGQPELLAYPVCGFSRKMKSFESVCLTSLPCPSLPLPGSCKREQHHQRANNKAEWFPFPFLHIQILLPFFCFLFYTRRFTKCCLTIKGMSWSVWSGRE